MKPNEFLRLIQEIGCILQLSAPTISHTISIYKKFTKSHTHQFKQEIVITACFYLVGKMVEDQRRIRDILVTISVVTKLYKHANLQRMQQIQESNLPNENHDPVQYLHLKNYQHEDVEFFSQLVPQMNDEQYQDWKKQVLEAEQHLLRIINYNLQTSTLDYYKILLNYLKIFDFEEPLRQLIFDIYQDTYFVEFQQEIVYYINISKEPLTAIKGSIYLGLKIHKTRLEENKIQVKVAEDMYKREWWESFMQVKFEDLINFQVEMLEYYDQNESFPA